VGPFSGLYEDVAAQVESSAVRASAESVETPPKTPMYGRGCALHGLRSAKTHASPAMDNRNRELRMFSYT